MLAADELRYADSIKLARLDNVVAETRIYGQVQRSVYIFRTYSKTVLILILEETNR